MLKKKSQKSMEAGFRYEKKSAQAKARKPFFVTGSRWELIFYFFYKHEFNSNKNKKRILLTIKIADSILKYMVSYDILKNKEAKR